MYNGSSGPVPFSGVWSSVNYSLSSRFATHQSLPCVKGGGRAPARSEGLCGTQFRIRPNPMRIRSFYRGNPSVCPSGSQLPLHKGAFAGAPAPVRQTVIFRYAARMLATIRAVLLDEFAQDPSDSRSPWGHPHKLKFTDHFTGTGRGIRMGCSPSVPGRSW